jgi:PilZ domain
MDYVERRSAQRYRFKFPLQVSWPGRPEALTETVEVSSRAVYFFLPETLALGTPLQFVFTIFPGLSEPKSVRLKCEGHVVRTEAVKGVQLGHVGIAASIDQYVFERLP